MDMLGYIARRSFHLSHRLANVRVRFAPSPTGYIHLGGIRTALYNYLFAKANNGKFILRIEDTDQKRLIPGAAEQLEHDLNWIGLTPNESPLNGGNYGPYTQSERLHIYTKYSQQLVENGFAYPCFCSDRRLEFVKKEALREGAIPRYDNRCRQLTSLQIEEKKRLGKPYCVRFKLTSLDTILKDIVYGDVDGSGILSEGDPVIMKQDGYPTYHLANVVDDHLMEITHVLRGTEWLVSTPKHLLLFKAFGWEPPSYAHLPLIMNADGTKLSKRQDDIRLEYFRSKGYFPEAIIGLLCLVGGGFLPSLNIQQKLHSLSELAKYFRLETVSTHSGKLDMTRLEYFNSLELRSRMEHAHRREELITDLSKILLEKQSSFSIDEEMMQRNNLLKVLDWAINEGRIHLLQQLVEPELGFLWQPQKNLIVPKMPLKIARSVIEKVIDKLEKENNANQDVMSLFLKKIATENNLKVNEVMKLMRSSLTGLKEGPPVKDIFEILGPRICASRLRSSLNLLSS